MTRTKMGKKYRVIVFPPLLFPFLFPQSPSTCWLPGLVAINMYVPQVKSNVSAAAIGVALKSYSKL